CTMRAPPNPIVSSKIRNLRANVNLEMQQTCVTKDIDSEAAQVMKASAPYRDPRAPAQGTGYGHLFRHLQWVILQSKFTGSNYSCRASLFVPLTFTPLDVSPWRTFPRRLASWNTQG